MSEIIQIRNLKKTFASDKSTVIALDGVDLSIEEGEIFGIIGLSGAGKSTLVRCMNYLESQPPEVLFLMDRTWGV